MDIVGKFVLIAGSNFPGNPPFVSMVENMFGEELSRMILATAWQQVDEDDEDGEQGALEHVHLVGVESLSIADVMERYNTKNKNEAQLIIELATLKEPTTTELLRLKSLAFQSDVCIVIVSESLPKEIDKSCFDQVIHIRFNYVGRANQSWKELALLYGISEERLKAIEEKALRKLR